jgi:hypothetical protein
MMRIFIVFNLTKHYYSGYIRKNEMAATCDAYGGEEMWRNRRDTVYFADLRRYESGSSRNRIEGRGLDSFGSG